VNGFLPCWAADTRQMNRVYSRTAPEGPEVAPATLKSVPPAGIAGPGLPLKSHSAAGVGQSASLIRVTWYSVRPIG
jgi:hypothetical protein